jgi:hypothetical protein
MPTHFPLESSADKDALAKLLNDQELLLAREVLSVHGITTGDASERINSVTVEFNVDADKLKRLRVEVVTPGATNADADTAPTPEAAKKVKESFLKFVAPLLEDAVLLARSEVFLKAGEVEIVLLRQADPLTEKTTGKILQGGPGWTWNAEVAGEDIVVRGAKATAFGGDNDAADSGQTACGFPTKGHPDLMGCALPLGGYANSAAEHAALDGTPLPHMPFGLTARGADNPDGAHVEVTDPATGVKTTVPVIDLGPAKNTGHALDLTVAAARVFKSNATANNFSMKLNYRIVGGAKFVK